MQCLLRCALLCLNLVGISDSEGSASRCSPRIVVAVPSQARRPNSSATCITNMWMMHLTGAVCILSGLPMYLNLPSMGACTMHSLFSQPSLVVLATARHT